jgi:3-hydroxyacyl-CoA dehydrogenase
MSGPVRFESVDGIGIATIDAPPVNALSAPVRAGLLDAVHRLAREDGLRGLVIAAEGRAFIAGADISEFGRPPVPPSLQEVVDALDTSPKPVVAAIHGTALGGGLEVAMACHVRLVGPAAKLGLPEVKLGLLPGAGGTGRAPRLMGAVPALALMTGGEPLGAEAAVRAGLAERVVEGDLLDAARARAAELAGGALPKPASARDEGLGPREAFEEAAAKLAKRAATEPQVAACIAAVRNAFDLPFAEAIAKERQAFYDLLADPRSRALRHVFFAERESPRCRTCRRARSRAPSPRPRCSAPAPWVPASPCASPMPASPCG